MADESISVVVQDRVPTTISTKLRDIANQAGAANAAINSLQTALNTLNAASLRTALSSGSSGASAMSSAVNTLNGQLATLTSAISSTNSVMGALAASATNLNASVQGVGTNIQSLTSAVQGLNTGAGNAHTSVTGLAMAFDVWAIAAEKVVGYGEKLLESVTTVVEWSAQADRLRIGLQAASGSAQDAAANQAYLTQTIQKLGLETVSTTDGFIKFAASTKNTALQGEATQQIFTSVAEAASVLHLSAQQTSDTLLALSQMASKGTVSMEELRQQLGDHIPGAMSLAASAMGVTTAQLQKMVSQGQVLSDDFLPKFAQALHDNYAGALEESTQSAQASLNRFSDAWTALEQTIGKSAIGDAARGQINIITDAVNGMTEAIGRAKTAGSGFWGQLGAGVGSALKFLNPVNAVDYTAQSNAGMEQQIQELTKARDVTKDWYQYNQLNYKINQLQTNLAKNQAADGTQSTIPQGMSAADKQRSANKQSLTTADSFINGTGTGESQFLTTTEKVTQSLTKLKAQFAPIQAAYDAGTLSLDKYNQALATYNARVDAVNTKAGKSAATAAHKQQQNELAAKMESLQADADSAKQVYDQGVANLQTALNQQRIDQTEYLTSVSDLKNQELTKLRDVAQQEADLAAGKDQLSVRAKYLNQVKEYNKELETNEAQTAAKIAAVQAQSVAAADKVVAAFTLAGQKRDIANAGSLSTTGQTTQQIADQQKLTEIMQSAATARQKILDDATAKGTQYTQGVTDDIDKINAAEQLQLANERTYFAQRNEQLNSFSYGFDSAMNQIIQSGQNAGQTFGTDLASGFDQASTALAQLTVTGKANFSSLISSMLQDLIKLELKYLASSALQTLFGSFDSAGAFGFTSTSSSASSNMIAGQYGGTAGLNTSSTLFGVGYASGGYTGDGGVNQPAGVVHKGEYVFTAAQTSALGVGTLKAIASGAKGYANGGYVTSGSSSSTGSTASAGVTFAPNINIQNNAANSVGVTAKTSTDSKGNPQIDIMVNQITNRLASDITKGKGALHDSIQNKFAVRSQPGR